MNFFPINVYIPKNSTLVGVNRLTRDLGHSLGSVSMCRLSMRLFSTFSTSTSVSNLTTSTFHLRNLRTVRSLPQKGISETSHLPRGL